MAGDFFVGARFLAGAFFFVGAFRAAANRSARSSAALWRAAFASAALHPRQRVLEDLGLARAAPRGLARSAPRSLPASSRADLAPMQLHVLVSGPTHTTVQRDERIFVECGEVGATRLVDEAPL